MNRLDLWELLMKRYNEVVLTEGGVNVATKKYLFHIFPHKNKFYVSYVGIGLEGYVFDKIEDLLNLLECASA